MKKIGFLTYEKSPSLYYDDQYLLEPFKEAGLEVIPLVWDQEKDLSGLDLIVFKSLWDYHFKVQKFSSWLNDMEQLHVPIFNPISIIKENYDKYYLKTLQSAGFSVIPSLFFDQVDTINLQQILTETNWERAIIKPTISMSAYHTYSFDAQTCTTLQSKLKDYYGDTKVMVQQFTNEIITEGEWSIIFYNKRHCMSVLKKPKAGDFRVQGEMGGTSSIHQAPENIIAEAKALLDHYDEEILYARVDGIIHQGHLQLMELELIDPELYFRFGSIGQKGFLKAIQEYL